MLFKVVKITFSVDIDFFNLLANRVRVNLDSFSWLVHNLYNIESLSITGFILINILVNYKIFKIFYKIKYYKMIKMLLIQ